MAAVAHGLERPVPEVAALCYWCDVVNYVRQVLALHTNGILTQE